MKFRAKTIRNFASKLVRDESGQSTTEYVLLLVFVVIAVKNVGKQLQSGLGELIGKAMNKATEAVESTPTN